ncbi:prion-inhibition and propagation-domain-containing protein [Rhypophila decipiens]|uniref:Prion-inhibition and propagation-domain-containing protein n=1 Tax=Rhypophila decipiens TaxID=261697 RepID=A0AAN7B480_9PEZI|nr:prion-inhibition and propagation-domain-containing protein [Rhypophila decipiens]
MDPVSICLSILPIFKVCLDYFDYFKTVRSLHLDCQILLLKLDFEHERMIIWGEKHGVFSTIGDGHDNHELNNPQVSKRLGQALGLINALFSDGERLKSQYGVKLLEDDQKSNNASGPKEKYVTTSALKRISKWINVQNALKANESSMKKPSLIGKTKWAIQDKAKFEALTRDIWELVSGLYDVLSVPDKERNRVALDDIQELLPDIGRLKQVEAASENIYPAWSEAASVIVLASEMGSLWSASASNHRHIQQAVQQTMDAQESEDEQGMDRSSRSGPLHV